MSEERGRQLLMAHLDGELSEEERGELRAAMIEDPSLRDELSRLEALGRGLARFRIEDPADEVLAALERGILKATAMPLGWFLFAGGALILFALAVGSVLLDPRLSLFFRGSAGGLLLGLILLFTVKVRERWLERKRDPYRYIVR